MRIRKVNDPPRSDFTLKKCLSFERRSHILLMTHDSFSSTVLVSTCESLPNHHIAQPLAYLGSKCEYPETMVANVSDGQVRPPLRVAGDFHKSPSKKPKLQHSTEVNLSTFHKICIPKLPRDQ